MHENQEQTPPAAAQLPTPPTKQQEAKQNVTSPPVPAAQQSNRQTENVSHKKSSVANHSKDTTVSNDNQKSKQQTQQQPQVQQQQQQQTKYKAPTSSSAGTGEHLLRMRERKTDNGHKPENVDGEFDFASSLSSFNKKEAKEEVLATSSTPAPTTYYNKDNFFDNISLPTDNNSKDTKTRMTPSEERQLNQDTFGATALQSNYRRFGRGGGRYSGTGRNSGGRGTGRSGGNNEGRGNSHTSGGRGNGSGDRATARRTDGGNNDSGRGRVGGVRKLGPPVQQKQTSKA